MATKVVLLVATMCLSVFGTPVIFFTGDLELTEPLAPSERHARQVGPVVVQQQQQQQQQQILDLFPPQSGQPQSPGVPPPPGQPLFPGAPPQTGLPPPGGLPQPAWPTGGAPPTFPLIQPPRPQIPQFPAQMYTVPNTYLGGDYGHGEYGGDHGHEGYGGDHGHEGYGGDHGHEGYGGDHEDEGDDDHDE